MKIKCEKCGEDLSGFACTRFEKNEVGRIQCPKCQKLQRRYISETDLLLYYGVSETYYVILSFITFSALSKYGITWYVSIAFGVALILSYFVFKELAMRIYENAYGKKETMYIEFNEDKLAIQKNLVWQSLLFYAIAITYFTGTEFSLFFIIALIFANLLTYLKYYLSLKKEKS